MAKTKTIKINLKISNRLLYSIITLILIVGIGVGVYAYGTSNPAIFGHSAGELTGVCKTDGTGCPTLSANDPRIQSSMKDMYVDSNKKLCYQNGTTTIPAGGCGTQTASCTKTEVISSPENGVCSQSLSVQNGVCSQDVCPYYTSCNGNTLSGCSGGTSVYYNDGTRYSCTPGNPTDTLKCTCKMNPALNYVQETQGTTTINTYRCL